MCVCTFTGQAVGGDARQSLSAHVAEGRSGVRAGVPVVHPGEMLHVELAGLRREKCGRKGGQTGSELRVKTGCASEVETQKNKTKIVRALRQKQKACGRRDAAGWDDDFLNFMLH